MDMMIRGIENLSSDTEPLLRAAVTRAAQHENVKACTLHMFSRDKHGWLEFLMVMEYTDGGKLTIGCIEREPNGQPEFHT